ncbi:MAG TPA: hypothetical protein VGG75_36070 [Trebonia sp.]
MARKQESGLAAPARDARWEEDSTSSWPTARGGIRPELRALRDSLAGTGRPATVLRWLDNNKDSTVLRDLAGGRRPLSHAALDELPDSKPLRHLRTILVATGALPTRDEQLARLETWMSRTVARRPGPEQRQLLHRYAVWQVVRRLRSGLAGEYATNGQFVAAQRNVRAAIALLDWLAARGLALETAGQGDLDTWMGEAQPGHRTDAGNFARWARRNKLTRLDFAATRWGGPSGVIDADGRWEQARRLLHDDSLRPDDRVTGLLVLLYAQRATAVSRLTLDHVTAADGQVLLRLGSGPVVLPGPSAIWSCSWRQPAAAMQPSATTAPRPGCSPAASPDSRSALSRSPNGCARSASTAARPVPPRCSSSPPTCPPQSWPACSASTSPSRSSGSAPPPATGRPTPPTSAAGTTPARATPAERASPWKAPGSTHSQAPSSSSRNPPASTGTALRGTIPTTKATTAAPAQSMTSSA